MTLPVPIFDRHARTALIVVCMLLGLGRLGFSAAVRSLNVYLQKERVELRTHFDNIATHVGDWEMVFEGEKLSAEMVEELGTDWYLDRRYARIGVPEDPFLNLHLAYYTGMIDAVPHVPDRCLVAGGFNARTTPVNLPLDVSRAGWTIDPEAGGSPGEPWHTVTYPDRVTRATVTVHMPRGDFELRTTEFSHPSQPDSRMFAGYFFIANGRIAVTPEDVKLIAFRKSERYAYYCKVQFFAVGDRDFTAERFAAHSADLTAALLPELMRCLPDWADIEGGAAGGSPATDS